ncbi:MAG: TonB-dependent receptor [bacterium]
MKRNLLIWAILLLWWPNLGAAQIQEEELTQITGEEILFTEIPVVFAAAKFEQKVGEAPASVTVITADEIKRYGYSTVSEALRGVPGLYVTYDRSYTHLGVRGYYIPGDYSSRVLVMIDGVTVNEPVYGGSDVENPLSIDIDSIKRIEVVKGPGSALYGTYALFGVINTVTKNGTDLNGLKVAGNYGSYQLKKGGLSYGRMFDNGVDVFISGHWMDSEGQDLYFPEYDDNDPKHNNGVFEDGDGEGAYDFFMKLAYGQLSLQAGLNEREKGLPTGAYETVFNDPRSKTVDGDSFVELKYDSELDETKNLLARIYYDHYYFDGDYIFWKEDEATGEPYKEDGVDWSRADWVGSEVQLNWKASEKNQLVVGGEYQSHYRIHQRSYEKGLRGPGYYFEYLDDKHQVNIWSFYLQDIYKVRENLSLTLGGRIDHYATFGETTNPRVGVVYNPGKYSSLKLLYGSAFRAPTFYELYYHDGYPKPANFPTMKPNPDLTPETLKTYELVFEQGIGGKIEASLSLYRTNLSDIISQVKIEEEAFEEPLLQFQDTGKAKANGIELSLKGRWNGLKGYLSCNYQKTEDESSHRELANSPRNSANLGLSLPLFQDRVYLTGEVQYMGKRLTVSEEEEWLSPYLVTNFSLFSRGLLPNMEITAKVNNLFNESYADPCSTEFKQTKIPQNRRNFLLKVGYKL